MFSNTHLKIKVKEEYATLVPKQSEAEFQSLKESIKEQGLMHAIVVNPEGVILDGHHRYKACQELGVSIRWKVKNFQGDQTAEKIFIVESNCARRNLTAFQRVEMAVKMEASYSEQAERRRMAGLKNVASSTSLVQNCTSDQKGRVIDKCAKIAGVSASYYNMARKVLQVASQDVLQELRENKRSVNEVYVSLGQKAATSASQIEQKGEQQQKGIQYSGISNENMSGIPKGIRLFCEDFHKFERRIPDNSVDLLVTFPDLYQQSVWSYFSFMVFAKRVLKKDTGALFIRVNQTGIDKVIALGRQAELEYQWTLAQINPNNNEPSFPKFVIRRFDPILIFSSGIIYKKPIDLDRVPDIIMIKDSGNDRTEQAAEFIIENFSREDDIVCDPMMGYGATAIAATKLRRQFRGLEKDHSQFAIALTKIRYTSASTTGLAA